MGLKVAGGGKHAVVELDMEKVRGGGHLNVDLCTFLEDSKIIKEIQCGFRHIHKSNHVSTKT